MMMMMMVLQMHTRSVVIRIKQEGIPWSNLRTFCSRTVKNRKVYHWIVEFGPGRYGAASAAGIAEGIRCRNVSNDMR